jgi:hypothetical protein
MPLKPAKHAAVRPAAQEAARRGAVGAPVSLRFPKGWPRRRPKSAACPGIGFGAHRQEGRFPTRRLKTCEPPRSFLSYAAQAHRKLHP